MSSQSNSTNHFHIEKLKGRENYADWKFAVEAYLELDDLFVHIKNKTPVSVEPILSNGVVTNAAEVAAAKQSKNTKLKLIMLCDPSVFSHIRDAETPAEVWKKLKNAFQDGGSSMGMDLYRELHAVRLEDCESTEQYVKRIIDTAHKLRSIGWECSDHTLGAILMHGLPSRYDPMVMAIEHSGVKISADLIKNKLLNDKKIAPTDGEIALAAKATKPKRTKPDKSKVRCYNCNELGHISRECKAPKKTAEKVLLTSFVAREPNDCDDWFIDSGASGHMTMKRENLFDISSPSNTEVIVADNSRMKIDCVGNIRLAVVNDRAENITVRSVQYVPNLCANLLSVSQMVRSGHTVTFDATGCKIVNASNELVAKAEMNNNMFKLVRDKNAASCFPAMSAGPSNQLLWHRRLGHPCYDKLNRLRNDLAQGFDCASVRNDSCIVCLQGKQARKPFNSTGTRAKQLLEIVHSDVCGPFSVTSMGGAKYFLLFLDDFSRMVFVYMLKQKSDVTEKFIEFQRLVENQTSKRIKIFRSDNGTEFVNRRMGDIMKRSGIVHQTSAPHTPQQNGMAERMNRSLVEKARCLMFDGKLRQSFWAEAVSTAAYLINRLPSSGTLRTPFEIWTGSKPDLSNLRVFGCKALAHVPKADRKKFDSKSTDCIMLGYSETTKGYRLYDKVKRKLITSRDVAFIEDQTGEEVIEASNSCTNFLSVNSVEDTPAADGPINEANETAADDETLEFEAFAEIDANSPESNIDSPALEANDSDRESPTNASSASTSELIIVSDESEHDDSDTSWRGDNENDSSSDSDSSVATVIDLTDESFFDAADNSANLDETLANSDPEYVPPNYRPGQYVLARPPNPERAAKTACIDALRDTSFVVKSAEVGDPISVKAAMNRSDAHLWQAAMKSEYDSLIENCTWELSDLPQNRRPIDCKWVFKTKRDANGEIVRHKARLVIKGCAQRYGIDYAETYAPVVRYSSIRYLLSMAARFDFEIEQMDAVTAFLQGELDEDIYMIQPEGFADGSTKVCRLKKSLYGLKQASRVWNAKLNTALIKFGMARSKVDPCVYFKRTHKQIIIIAVYVDDLLMFSNDSKLTATMKNALSSAFKMKDLGEVTSILGMNVTRDRKKGIISIDQSSYIAEILERFGMENSHPVSSPLDTNVTMSKAMCPANDVEKGAMFDIPYQEAVGSLMYAAQVSRPDICFALSVVSRFNHNPGKAHWQAVKRIFRYLRGTIGAKLTYTRDGNGQLTGYCDADFAGDEDERKSTTGYVFLLNGGAITWNSRKQPTVALSTTEAEYMSLTAAVQESEWLRQFNNEVFGTKMTPIPIYCDNRSALALAATDMYHARTKHIDIKFHFVREKVRLGLIHLHHVETSSQFADVLTKSLVPCKHRDLISNLGLNFA